MNQWSYTDVHSFLLLACCFCVKDKVAAREQPRTWILTCSPLFGFVGVLILLLLVRLSCTDTPTRTYTHTCKHPHHGCTHTQLACSPSLFLSFSISPSLPPLLPPSLPPSLTHSHLLGSLSPFNLTPRQIDVTGDLVVALLRVCQQYVGVGAHWSQPAAAATAAAG
jgi:hypothetical protein